MVPLVPLALLGVGVWTLAIKRIIDYNLYKNRQEKSRTDRSHGLSAYQPRNLGSSISLPELPRFEDKRTYSHYSILFKDCSFYVAKGGRDGSE